MVTFLRVGAVLPSGECEECLVATRGLTPCWRVLVAWLKAPTRCLVGSDSAFDVWVHVAIVRLKAHDIFPAMLVCEWATCTDSEQPTLTLSLEWECQKPSCLAGCDRLLFFVVNNSTCVGVSLARVSRNDLGQRSSEAGLKWADSGSSDWLEPLAVPES